MIDLKTAQRLYEVCAEIEDCKGVLALFKYSRNKPLPHITSVYVARNETVEGETIELLPGIAKEAIEKQLAILTEQHQSLSDQISATAMRERKLKK